MTSFIGDYTCKMDAKGRVLFPAAFKRQMSGAEQDRFVLKKDIFEKCLVLYPIDEWNRLNAIIRNKINPYNKEHNRFLRGFFKDTAEVILDNNNRFLIPKRLIELAGIDSDIYLAGQTGKIEIWAKQSYESQIDTDVDFALLAESILGGDMSGFTEI